MSAKDLLAREGSPLTPRRRRREPWYERAAQLVIDVVEYLVTWEPMAYRDDFGRGRHAATA